MLPRTNSTVFQSYHITNKRFQFLRVVSRWQQDFKLLQFKYIASQQITTTYLTCLNQYSSSMMGFFFLRRNLFSFYWMISMYKVWIQESPWTTKTWLTILRGINLKVLKCCQVVTRFSSYALYHSQICLCHTQCVTRCD